MKFYFQDRNGNRRELTDNELREHMSEFNVYEAMRAKYKNPNEEVSYTTDGGFIICDMDDMEKAFVIAEKAAARQYAKKMMEIHERFKAEHPRPKHKQKKE